MKPVIAITIGDYNGIGPEVVLKSVARAEIRRICSPVLVGPTSVFASYLRRFSIPLRFRPFDRPGPAAPRTVAVHGEALSPVLHVRPGSLSAGAGAAAGAAIEEAVHLVRSGRADAIVTAPVSKQALHLAGIHVPGQTELLQKLTRSAQVAMMLVSPALRVGLVTIHVPLRAVSSSLTPDLLLSRCGIIHDALRADWGIRRPRLAVLGLNPHAGEGGDIGTEEQRLILPAIAALRRKGIRAEGPFPADAFFARYTPGSYDAVVAMYHDQGLIPIKMSAGGRAVNVSVGLPIVRTSPDHGTAFDIAGRGIADPRSMEEAIRVAVNIAGTRRRRPRKETA